MRDYALHARRVVIVAFLAVCVSSTHSTAKANLSDTDIRQRMIEESIRSYHGSCPCPYNAARNGSKCGGRSAYSRPGGASPLCYPSDISDEMVRRYRQQKGL